MSAFGCRPSSLARSTDMTNTLAAPSVSGLELRQFFEARVRPDVVIAHHRAAAIVDDVHRRHLLRQTAILPGRGRLAMRAQRPGVLGSPTDAVELGHELGRLAHAEPGRGFGD